jgi:hypothetical protein
MPNYGAPSEDLAALLHSQQDGKFIARVAAVNEDGTVSLEWGADPILNVPCSGSYTNRQEGQTVIVERVAGQIIVTGTTATQDTDFQALIDEALDPIQDALNDTTDFAEAVNDDVTRLENIRTRVTFGTAAAPSGFLQADSVWFKDQGGGRVDLYLRRSTDPGSGSSAPPTSTKPPTHKVPKPVTITPNSRGSWRSSGQKDGDVWQGDWTGRGNWRGGWFYGTKIADACSGKTVKSMTLYLSRTKDGSGWNRGVPAHVNLHNETSKAKPSPIGTMHSVKLAPGQVVKYQLPSAWISALASGSARGFMVSGSGRSDYLKCAGSAGKLVIKFS